MATYLGIDIGGTNIKVGIVSEDGAIRAFATEAAPGAGTPTEAVDLIVRAFGRLTQDGRTAPVLACCAGCAGLVDASKGIVKYSPNLPQWQNVGLAAMLEEALALPSRVENDANAAVYGEYLTGAARGATNAVLITLGTGVGGGIILDGRLFRGSGGGAGEIGHMTIDSSGPLCSCGSRGCFEALVNAESIVTRALALLSCGDDSVLRGTSASRELTARDVGEAAAAGDAVATAAIEETGRVLGAGLANLILALNPDVIVVGGGVAGAGEVLLGPARREMARRAFVRESTLPRVVRAELGARAGVIGSALLARDILSSV